MLGPSIMLAGLSLGSGEFILWLYLLYMNNKILSRSLSMSPIRFVALVWSCAFFGYFSFQAMKIDVIPYLASLIDKLLEILNGAPVVN